MSLLSQMQIHLASPAQLQGTEGKGICGTFVERDCRKAMPKELSPLSFWLQRIRIRIECAPGSRCTDKDEWH